MPPNKVVLLQAFESAPKAIQDSLTEGAAVDFIVSMRKRYGLHIDTAGKVAELVRNLLLGFLNPPDFVRNLVSLGITSDSAQLIVSDLNREVFIPIRNSMKGEDAGIDTRPTTHVPSIGVMEVGNQQSQAHQNPLATQPPFNLVSQEEHVPVQAPPIPHPWQTSPASSFQTASVPYTSTPYASQPAAQAAPVEHIQIPSIPELPKNYTPPATPQQSTPLTKEYSVDPYREPIQ